MQLTKNRWTHISCRFYMFKFSYFVCKRGRSLFRDNNKIEKKYNNNLFHINSQKEGVVENAEDHLQIHKCVSSIE